MEVKTFHWNIVLVCTLLLAAGIGYLFNERQQNVSSQNMQAPPVIHGAILPIAKNIGEFELRQSGNRLFNQEQLKNKWSLLFIGYTYCPDVCPSTLHALKQSVTLMKQKGLTPPQVVFISIDPERDKVDMLNEYVQYFNKNFIGVTGDEEELDDFARQLAVYYRKVPNSRNNSGSHVSNNDYLMEHSASLMLISPRGNLQAMLTEPHIPQTIVESIRKTQSYYQANH